MILGNSHPRINLIRLRHLRYPRARFRAVGGHQLRVRQVPMLVPGTARSPAPACEWSRHLTELNTAFVASLRLYVSPDRNLEDSWPAPQFSRTYK